VFILRNGAPLGLSEETLARGQLLKKPFPYTCSRPWITLSMFRATVYEISRLVKFAILEKKEPDVHQVNHAVLQVVQPEQVIVEMCRSEELDRRRGLTSELDEMWSYVCTIL
jgi:predicted AAA+ superfamily ATPase